MMKESIRAPKSQGRIEVVSKTSMGRRRANQDFLHVEQFATEENDVMIAVIADGMGGHHAGEVASRLAVEIFSEFMKQEMKKNLTEWAIRNNILRAYSAVNEQILEKEKRHPEMRDMGTTLTALIFVNRRFLVCSLGDSRAYKISAEDIRQLTVDHSAGAEAIRQGLISEIEAQKSHYSNSLTKYLGTNETFVPDIFPVNGFLQAESGDVFMLSTDGVSGVLDELSIYEQVVQTPSLKQAAQNLLSLSYVQGSKDNMSLVLMEMPRMERKKPYVALFGEAAAARPKREKKKSKKAAFLAAAFVLIVLESIFGILIYRESQKSSRSTILAEKTGTATAKKEATPTDIKAPADVGILRVKVLSGFHNDVLYLDGELIQKGLIAKTFNLTAGAHMLLFKAEKEQMNLSIPVAVIKNSTVEVVVDLVSREKDIRLINEPATVPRPKK